MPVRVVKPGDQLGFQGTDAELKDPDFATWVVEARDNFALIRTKLADAVNPKVQAGGSLISKLTRKDRKDSGGKVIKPDLTPLYRRIATQPKESVPWRRLANGNYQCEFRTSRYGIMAEYDSAGNLRNYQIQGS